MEMHPEARGSQEWDESSIFERVNELRPLWMERGACRSHSVNEFFPDRGRNIEIAQAKAICRTCPVIVPCLEYALDRPGLQGIWGGRSIRQRHELMKGRRIA
jgi:WhiB family redox-sensing transcriptional regulator